MSEVIVIEKKEEIPIEPEKKEPVEIIVKDNEKELGKIKEKELEKVLEKVPEKESEKPIEKNFETTEVKTSEENPELIKENDTQETQDPQKEQENQEEQEDQEEQEEQEDQKDEKREEVDIKENESECQQSALDIQLDEEAIEEELAVENLLSVSFLKKVYGILTLHLLISYTFILLFHVKKIQVYVFDHPRIIKYSMFSSLIVFVLVYFLLICNRKLARKVPYNYIFLFIITVCQSIVCSFVGFMFSAQTVTVVFLLIIATSLSITIYSAKYKNDFNYLYMFLIGIFAQVGVLLILFFILKMELKYMLYSFCCSLIIGIYLILHSFLILAKFRFDYSIDDYIFASLELYIDILRLFFEIIKVVAVLASNRR